jgi:hypothetical protein
MYRLLNGESPIAMEMLPISSPPLAFFLKVNIFYTPLNKMKVKVER